jgi:hypothetical protein
VKLKLFITVATLFPSDGESPFNSQKLMFACTPMGLGLTGLVKVEAFGWLD